MLHPINPPPQKKKYEGLKAEEDTSASKPSMFWGSRARDLVVRSPEPPEIRLPTSETLYMDQSFQVPQIHFKLKTLSRGESSHQTTIFQTKGTCTNEK